MNLKDIGENDLKSNLKLVSKKKPDQKTVVDVKNHKIGGDKLTIIAGPCTVESKEQIMDIAKNISERGAHMMRGGVFKPITFPYGDPLARPDKGSDKSEPDKDYIPDKKELLKTAERRLKYMAEAGKKYELPVVTEVIYSDTFDMMNKYVDMFQIGYRSMMNFDLLRTVAGTKKPVLLKRHAGESLRAFLGAAEHIIAHGNPNIVLCERGIMVPHTHRPESRHILDVQAVPALNEYTHLPVILDPSHSTFHRPYVAPMSRASIAAGADGIEIEVHPEIEGGAWVDPLNPLDYTEFKKLMIELKGIGKVLGKSI